MEEAGFEHTGIMALQGCARASRYVEPLDWALIVKVRQMEGLSGCIFLL